MTQVLRTGTAIDRALEADRAALVIYLPVGFPDVATSIRAAQAAVAAGADIIELGLPYSDPVLDGSLIAQAGAQALEQGTRIKDVLTAVREVADTGASSAVMTYFNPVFKYGVERFSDEFAAAGGAGLITPDLTPEYAQDWIAAADARDLDKIFLVAPSSTPERLEITATASRGFVYAASTMGVTGTRDSLSSAAKGLVQATREAGAPRVCVGVGVSNPDQAREVASYADGVIVGSAAVRALKEDPSCQKLTDLVRSLYEATHRKS